MLQGLIILLLFQLTGEALAAILGLPVPGAVIGMLLLWGGLHIKGSASDSLLKTSAGLSQHLSLLFLPAAVGLFFLPSSIMQYWPAVISAIVVATFISMVFTGLLLKLLARKRGAE
jgi:holin-like protein